MGRCYIVGCRAPGTYGWLTIFVLDLVQSCRGMLSIGYYWVITSINIVYIFCFLCDMGLSLYCWVQSSWHLWWYGNTSVINICPKGSRIYIYIQKYFCFCFWFCWLSLCCCIIVQLVGLWFCYCGIVILLFSHQGFYFIYLLLLFFCCCIVVLLFRYQESWVVVIIVQLYCCLGIRIRGMLLSLYSCSVVQVLGSWLVVLLSLYSCVVVQLLGFVFVIMVLLCCCLVIRVRVCYHGIVVLLFSYQGFYCYHCIVVLLFRYCFIFILQWFRLVVIYLFISVFITSVLDIAQRHERYSYTTFSLGLSTLVFWASFLCCCPSKAKKCLGHFGGRCIGQHHQKAAKAQEQGREGQVVHKSCSISGVVLPLIR